MKKTSKLLSLFLALAMIFSLAIPAMAAEEAPAPAPYAIGDVKDKLVILHTNDTHGSDLEKNGKTIGTAGIAQLKKDFEAAGAEVILMSAGDAIMGTPLVNDSKGATAIEFMNAAKYDVMTMGNHEMDFGAENLKALAKAAKFPILGANVLDEKTGKPAFEANKVITTKSGLKVGVFGLATPETLTKADASKMPGLTFLEKAELYACAQAQVDELKKAGAEFIVCLGHLGVDEESAGNHSYDVCNNVTGIDLFVDGHSHTVMKDGKPVDEKAYPSFENKSKALIVSTGTALKNVGVVVYDKAAKTMKSELIAAASYTKVDAALAKTIAAADKKVTEKYSAVIGKTEVDLNGTRNGGKATSTAKVDVAFPAGEGNRTAETNLGDFATDAILWQARKVLGQDKVDAAVTNGGGIRETLSKGNISKLDLFKVFPFGNVVSTITVTGAQLLEALEAATFCTPTAVGAFPQVAGIEFTVNTAVPYAKGSQYLRSTYYAPAAPGSRVTITSVNGKAWDAKANYVLATNDFTAAGGDTFGVFKTAGGWKSLGVPLEEALINYTTEVLKGTIPATYAKPAGRITIENKPLDLTAGTWFYDAARYVLDNGIMAGVGEGLFAPDALVTRATVFQVLYNLENKPAAAAGAEQFADVAKDAWYADAALWAKSAALTTGTDIGFEGEKNITRQELAKVLADYAAFKHIVTPTAGTAMKDAPDYDKIGSWALDGMSYCYYSNILTGDQNKNLDPTGTAQRSSLAQTLLKFSALKPAYSVKNVTVKNGTRDVVAVVTMPVGEGKFPAVVMNHGHGGSKDENGGFAGIADSLARKGIASIRMDFPGCGESKAPFTDNYLSNMVSDSNACKDYLVKNYPVDAKQLGIFGYSMGGRIALDIVTKAGNPYAAVALLAGSTDDGSKSVVDLMGGQESYDKFYAQASGKQGYAAFPWFGRELHISKAWFDDMKASKPLASAAKYTGPLLVVYGDKDTTVPPAVNQGTVKAFAQAQELVITDADHGYGFYSNQPTVTAAVEDGLTNFFLKSLVPAVAEKPAAAEKAA